MELIELCASSEDLVARMKLLSVGRCARSIILDGQWIGTVSASKSLFGDTMRFSVMVRSPQYGFHRIEGCSLPGALHLAGGAMVKTASSRTA